MGIHYLQRLKAANVPKDLIEKGQNRVIEASLTLIRERAKLKVFSYYLIHHISFAKFRALPLESIKLDVPKCSSEKFS